MSLSLLLVAETSGDKSGGSPAEDPGETEGAERPETGLGGHEREWISNMSRTPKIRCIWPLTKYIMLQGPPEARI